VATSVDDLVTRQTTRRAGGEILNIDEHSALAAGRLRVWRNRQPVVEGAALIDLEVAPS
jgi:hypothetical protein